MLSFHIFVSFLMAIMVSSHLFSSQIRLDQKDPRLGTRIKGYVPKHNLKAINLSLVWAIVVCFTKYHDLCFCRVEF